MQPRNRLAGMVLLALASIANAEPGDKMSGVGDVPPLYKPANRHATDWWFAKSAGTYYAFYLHSPVGAKTPYPSQWAVGLAVGQDLWQWHEMGEVLAASPDEKWNDREVATGSTWRHGAGWRMVFTARAQKGGGIGLAESADLIHWKKIGSGPVQLHYQPFEVPTAAYWQDRGFSAGQTLTYRVVADPYVLPEPSAGWHYLAANCRLQEVPEEVGGCINLMRSRDGLAWEDLGLIAAPNTIERMETPQLWQHAGRWYLLFGAAYDKAVVKGPRRSTHVFYSDNMQGPFVAPGRGSEIKLPDGAPFYLAKVMADPRGRDVLLAGLSGSRLSQPYLVTYQADGSLGLTVAPQPALGPSAPELAGNRFFTFTAIVRVNQIEAARELNLGHDESALHTPAAVQTLRDAFAKAFPSGCMTWAFSWRALQDPRPNYQAIRNLVVDFHRRLGDEITFIPGAYFAPMYNSRAQINRDLHDGLKLVAGMVGGGYRPHSVVAGFLTAENQRYLAEQEGIHVCQGTIWSQYGIDNGDGDGSLSYPYYPSREHYCKPAQGLADFIDCVCLDGWTCDFLAARRPGFAGGFNSRMGLGPIETLINLGHATGLREQLAVTATHFDEGFQRNGFAWLTTIWEVSLVASGCAQALPDYGAAVRRRWPDVQGLPVGEFGETFRRQHKDNAALDYRFVQRGSGIGGSDAEQEIRWFMNRDFRLAVLKNWRQGGPERVIDFTRYDLPAREPQDRTRNWSLMNRINQKGVRPQDKPVALTELPPADRDFIRKRYPELF